MKEKTTAKVTEQLNTQADRIKVVNQHFVSLGFDPISNELKRW